jgi:cathepsin E
MIAASLLSTLLLAMAVAAQPVEQRASHPSLVKLAFTKHIIHGGNLVRQDQLRANIIKGDKAQDLKNRDVVNSQAQNIAVTYVASVGVGSPATNCE